MNARLLGVASTLLSACASLPPNCVAPVAGNLAPTCVAAPRCRFNCDITITITRSDGVATPPPVTVNAEATQSLTRARAEP